MTFTIFDILIWTLINLNSFIVIKIVVRDKRVHLKESVYIIFASLLLTCLVIISINAFDTGITISGIVTPPLCILYLHKLKSYSIKKSIILVLISMLVIAMSDTLALMVISFVSSDFLSLFPNFPLLIGMSLTDALRFLPYILVGYIGSILATLLLVKVTKNLRKLINQSSTMQTVLAYISSFSIIFIFVVVSIWRYLGAQTDFLAFSTIALLGIALSALLALALYTMSLKVKSALREQEALQYYMNEIEQQQATTRKTIHDVQNILSSMYGFIHEKDWDGLTQYHATTIEAFSEVMAKNIFALDALRNIKPREIKGTLAMKLLKAQSLGIDTTFETDGEIDHIPTDSVMLVRALGILLDNAIEELTELGSGKLLVGCYKRDASVIFVIQNSCRPDIPSLRQLNQSGFSTKGTDRGIGLSNLTEFVSTYPNVSLNTNITEGNFIQKLVIGGE